MIQKRRPGEGGAVLLGCERVSPNRNRSAFQSPWRGWNLLSLGSGGDAALIDSRPVRVADPVPVPCIMPKPARPLLRSNGAMARALAAHQFQPLWLRSDSRLRSKRTQRAGDQTGVWVAGVFDDG
jgi:hypothetical protein